MGCFLFCDVIWYFVGDFGGDKEISFMIIVSVVVNYCGIDIMLYILCVNIVKVIVIKYLMKVKFLGIRNIFVFRGGKYRIFFIYIVCVCILK